MAVDQTESELDGPSIIDPENAAEYAEQRIENLEIDDDASQEEIEHAQTIVAEKVRRTAEQAEQEARQRIDEEIENEFDRILEEKTVEDEVEQAGEELEPEEDTVEEETVEEELETEEAVEPEVDIDFIENQLDQLDQELEEADIDTYYGVWRVQTDDLLLKLIGRDETEPHPQTRYAASEIGLIEDDGLDAGNAGNARHEMREEQGFEIEWGDLVTEVPEPMAQAVETVIELYDFNPEEPPEVEEAADETREPSPYRFEENSFVIDDGVDVDIRIWEENAELTPEARVLAYAVGGPSAAGLPRGEEQLQEQFGETVEQLEEKGLIEKKEVEDPESDAKYTTGKATETRYEVATDLPENIKQSYLRKVRATRDGRIQVAKVEGVGDSRLTLNYEDGRGGVAYNPDGIELGDEMLVRVEDTDFGAEIDVLAESI